MPTSPTLCGQGRFRVADVGVHYTQSQLELQKTGAATASRTTPPATPAYHHHHLVRLTEKLGM